MRFHVLEVHKEEGNDSDPVPFSRKVHLFAKMMRNLGHTVYVHDKPYVESIDAVIQRRDFLCVLGSCYVDVTSKYPDHMAVEFGIGYIGQFSPYRVFESYAWMHMSLGAHYGWQANGEAYWTVIPNFFEPETFPFVEVPDDYFLYLGRVTPRKGWYIAVDVAYLTGIPLIVAGALDRPLDRAVDYRGEVSEDEKLKLLSGAKAVFCPTQYIEPFNNVHIEAQLCGTPVISTDWGSYTETITNGFNGYRCSILRDYVRATELVGNLDRVAIREAAVARYSTNVIGPQYEDYFHRLETLWDKGWYAAH